MYAKLVLRSARRSVGDYLIYLVTLTLCVGLFYAFLSISSRHYHPDIGAEFDLTFLSDGMKVAVCGVTLLLWFLIRYVNRYMLRQKQPTLAIQGVLGMESRTMAWLFFAETFCVSLLALGLGLCALACRTALRHLGCLPAVLLGGGGYLTLLVFLLWLSRALRPGDLRWMRQLLQRQSHF